MPKVSVCIATYNRATLLPYAVNSVLTQTYTDFELIICDDGSKDDTPTVVSQWNDPRIRYIRHPQNIGRSKNMRSGFDAACGDYFIKFDDDDALTPEFLEKTVAVLEAEPTVDFVCTNHWVINQNGERNESATRENSVKWKKDKLKEDIIPELIKQTFEYQSLQVGSTLFRRSCLEEVNYMRPEADGCEDYDLLVRLAIAGKQGYFLPEFLMEYRFHGGQTSLKQNLHFLSAKVFCISSYKFPTEELEKRRIKKLAWTKEVFGLRLIETGNTVKGRQMLRESAEVMGNSRRIQFGLILSYLPLSLRKFVFQGYRQFRPKDYTEQVRETTN
ncbi:MAG TPA: glycosyl transferase family 2 [Cyanobacteria bacterium UBA12227]|nr:glycosyl transferase family 2 [Cyanobacteria bacterium UBA12227]HAX87372.1 glycosyl transferase family 2 [Cyanobacteria bacterium UBA11370]HBY80885.1 glycosyl transferase family 2 [Cyanobacteria bacterium UBA11148]